MDEKSQDVPLLAEEMFKHMSSGTFCDVTFTIGDDTCRAHSAVLATRSKYFACMFYGSFKESNTRTADMTKSGISMDSFKTILQYIYLGTCSITLDNVIEILQVASLFLLEDLRKKCSKFLLRNLRPNNCVFILAWAEHFSLIKLTAICSQMVCLWLDQRLDDLDILGISKEMLTYLQGINAFRNVSILRQAIFMYSWWQQNMTSERMDFLLRQNNLTDLLSHLAVEKADFSNSKQIAKQFFESAFPFDCTENDVMSLNTLSAMIVHEEEKNNGEEDDEGNVLLSIAFYIKKRKEWVQTRSVSLPKMYDKISWNNHLNFSGHIGIFRNLEKGNLLWVDFQIPCYGIVPPPNSILPLEEDMIASFQDIEETEDKSTTASLLPELPDYFGWLKNDTPLDLSTQPPDVALDSVSSSSGEDTKCTDPNPYIFIYMNKIFSLSRMRGPGRRIHCPTCQSDAPYSNEVTYLTLTKLNDACKWEFVDRFPVVDTTSSPGTVLRYSRYQVEDSDYLYLIVSPSGDCENCNQRIWFHMTVDCIRTIPVLPKQRTKRQRLINWARQKVILQLGGRIGIAKSGGKLVYGVFYNPDEQRWTWERTHGAEPAHSLDDSPGSDCCTHNFSDCKPEMLVKGLKYSPSMLCPHYRRWNIEGCGTRIWRCDGKCKDRNETVEEVPCLPEDELEHVKSWKEISVPLSTLLQCSHIIGLEKSVELSDDVDEVDGPLADCDFDL